jgi:RHS repeat-associated protein
VRNPDLGPGGGTRLEGACDHCEVNPPVGFPSWQLSEAYNSIWVRDTPLDYTPAYGPHIPFTLALDGHRDHGFYDAADYEGAWMGMGWSCSWLSYLVVDASGYDADVSLPGSGWGLFSFQAGATNSDVNYKRNTWLEKLFQGASLVGLRLHEGGGSYLDFGRYHDGGTVKIFFLTSWYDAQGNAVNFNYTTNSSSEDLLSTVTFADSTAFQVHYDDPYDLFMPTSVSSSIGLSTSFIRAETNYSPGWYFSLTTIIDAAGITNHIAYDTGYYVPTRLITPYGTTTFTSGDANGGGVFDLWIRITQADTSQQFYGLLNIYAGTNWPDFAAGQIPTNTPVGTLDTTGRTERNTFFWDSRQFSGLESKDLTLFDWADFKKARIRHWLASVAGYYTHYDTLSMEQAPSPDGATEGQLTWYDYLGKATNINYEHGTQIMPSVIARVMPDGSTAYQYFDYNSIGKATNQIEKWVAGGATYYRTNTFKYSADGIDLLEWRGPYNELISGRGYNAYHQLLTDTNAVGDVASFTYETSAPRRLLTSMTAGGLLSTDTYDGSGRLQKVVDSSGGTPIRTNSYTWLNGDLRTVTDPRGLTVTNTYDAIHRLTRVDYPDSTYQQYAYTNGAGLMLLDLTAARDRLGFWTYYAYDPLRRLLQITDARTNVTGFGYCTCGALEYMTNAVSTPIQEVTHYIFDNQGHRTQTILPDTTSVTNTYDALGRLTVVSDALGKATNYYDNLGRLTNVSNYAGQVSKAIYDLRDRATNTVDANGVSVTNSFDNLDRLLTRTYPDVGVEKFNYTARGLTNYVNQLSKTNRYVFDAAGRKTFETNANSEVIKYTYNAASDLLTLTDGKNQVTTWHYDQYGRVTNKLDQASVEILRYKYDADNRLTNRWSKAKGDTYYTYDNVGNLTFINYPANPDITLQYDALNRLTNMVDAVGTNAYSYWPGGLLHTDDGPFANDTVSYTNNAARLRQSMTLQQPSGVWTQAYAYDAAKRLTNTVSAAGTFAYSYVAPRSLLPAKILLPITSYITNTYDNVARLTGTYLKNSGNTNLNYHTYGYNQGNQRTNMARTDASSVTYIYDNIGQLKTAVGSGGQSTESLGYNYDAAWNLNQRTNTGATSTFGVDSKNQLTSDPGYTDKYDDNGNLSWRTNGANLAYSYSYDDENELTSMAYQDPAQPTTAWWRADFVYDGRGRLRLATSYTWTIGSTNSYWSSNGNTEYIYDGTLMIQNRNSIGGYTPQYSYTRGLDLSGTLEGAGGIGGMLARSQSTTHYFYHTDGNGNLTCLEQSNQTVAGTTRYDPFGNTIGSSGLQTAFGFSSKFSSRGLYYYGYRWYDPNLQRWPKRDPIHEFGFLALKGRKMGFHEQAELNLSRFVGNEPIFSIDPVGLSHRFGGLTGGKCCNKSSGNEWWIDDGVWKRLPPGKCTGTWDDCDGMTCGGGFYYIQDLDGGSCVHPGKDNPKFCQRRWTPTNQGPQAQPPGPPYPGYPGPDRGGPVGNPPPPGYTWGK